ncbi:hypothetical protein O3P69_006470 [Scylla paramamosain]|uniref:Neurotransmitter-gated ion-channel transmembrane domain-containing protein n=1 Tax=Scylla paramamosain TaxID=85552 RepID=A0AAW0U2J3_SCYPA
MMNLRNFPFDLQRCHLQLRLDSGRDEFVQWGNVTGIYLGEELLTEYEIGGLTVDRQVIEGYSVAIISFTMNRRSSFYITSAYLPTTMLLLISYSSLYCPRDNRDLRVLMALTTLLVLYSLYQQISDNLPKTSYIKAIDIWFFFCITFIFSQVGTFD